MTREQIKPALKVKHKLHGTGIIMRKTGDPTSVMVKFDKYIEDWGTDLLEVSLNQLEIIKPKKHKNENLFAWNETIQELYGGKDD
jgi:hypothetical protein